MVAQLFLFLSFALQAVSHRFQSGREGGRKGGREGRERQRHLRPSPLSLGAVGADLSLHLGDVGLHRCCLVVTLLLLPGAVFAPPSEVEKAWPVGGREEDGREDVSTHSHDPAILRCSHSEILLLFNRPFRHPFPLPSPGPEALT